MCEMACAARASCRKRLKPCQGCEGQQGARGSRIGLARGAAGAVLSAFGLVEVGAREVACLEAAFNVGGQRNSIIEAAQRSDALSVSGARLPVGFPNLASQLPLGTVECIALQVLLSTGQR